MSTPQNPAPTLLTGAPLGMLKVHRGQLIAVAIIGLILGIIGLIFPDVTLLTVAVLFGSYLIASGIFRITAALVADHLTVPLRWLTGLLGLVVIIAGILALANPFDSLVVLAVVIGFGWIAEGIVDFMSALRGAIIPRWLGFVSGIIAIGAGIAMFVLPAAGITSLVLIGSALLIAVSVTTLLTIPRKAKAA
ncbi:HdeD family acid-resistance protein [Marisediminicola sp. LYQ134]|uniref:HdeD family acid-resistance protein n=1 Tax=unclassified Marisediminicola TaxID=2618316 RepID=UPI0039837CFC